MAVHLNYNELFRIANCLFFKNDLFAQNDIIINLKRNKFEGTGGSEITLEMLFYCTINLISKLV